MGAYPEVPCSRYNGHSVVRTLTVVRVLLAAIPPLAATLAHRRLLSSVASFSHGNGCVVALRSPGDRRFEESRGTPHGRTGPCRDGRQRDGGRHSGRLRGRRGRHDRALGVDEDGDPGAL